MEIKRNIFIAFILNLAFSLFELFGGFFTGSVAILSDAVHDFGDAVSIGSAYFLEKLSNKAPNEKFTYGYARCSVLGGLITTLILFISSGVVIYNAILRILTPTTIDYNSMLVFAIIGFSVNLLATYVTHGGNSINQKAVNLHMLEDVLGWLVVFVGALVMRFTNWYVIDPILSIAVALFILFHCVQNLKEIGNIFLMKTPKNVNVAQILEHIKHLDGVLDVHHLHVWTIDGGNHCATLHVVAERMDNSIKSAVKEELNEHGIAHVTVEMETLEDECNEKACHVKTSIPHCHHHHG